MDCIRLTTLLALPIAVSLMLGAMPGDARADICKKRNLGKGCVDSADVKDGSLGKIAVTNIGQVKTIDVKDEAGLGFEISRETGGGFSRVAAVLHAPRDGWAIATPSANIRAKPSATSAGGASCEISARRPTKGGFIGSLIAEKQFSASVNPEREISFKSMFATLGFRVNLKKGDSGVHRVDLFCSTTGFANIEDLDLTVQYFPTEY